MKKSVKPALLGGFRDLLPPEAYAQQEMFTRIKQVYESFGYMPLETPGMEKLDVLIGNEQDFEKSIFAARIMRGAEDRNVSEKELSDNFALRFDLTVPLARVIASYPDLPRPFKRYQLGKVWRGESPQAGRYREFSQFDFDIIGADGIWADIEVIHIMYETMKALGLYNFVIRYNSRKILNGLAEIVGLPNSKNLFRILDKIDKIGIDDVISELKAPIEKDGLNFSSDQASTVRSFLEINNNSGDDILLSSLKGLFGDDTEVGKLGIEELSCISISLETIGVPSENLRMDFSVARGLDYYTGPVFEAYLLDAPQFGSVFSGGRFDGLTDRFIPGSNISGVGASVGVDRLFVAMNELGLIKLSKSITDVLVTTLGDSRVIHFGALEIAQQLRNQGIKTESYLGNDKTVRAQVAYASKKSIPWVIIIGENEISQGVCTLKNMGERTQETLTSPTLIAKLVRECLP